MQQFALRAATIEELAGGDRHANATIVRNLLGGKESGPKRDAILLNAGAALFVANRASSLSAGWDLAADVIDDGHALKRLNELAS